MACRRSNTWRTVVLRTPRVTCPAQARVACMMQALDEIVTRPADSRDEQLQQILQRHARLESCTTACGIYPCRNPSLKMPCPHSRSSSSAIGFSFEYVLTNLLFVPFVSGAAYNGDMATMTFGFSAQSDEARHMTLGLELIKFIFGTRPGQRADRTKMDRQMELAWLPHVDPRGDDDGLQLPKRVMSWKEAWEVYYEENGGALFKDLARYGIRPPQWIDQIEKEKRPSVTSSMGGVLQLLCGIEFPRMDAIERSMDWLASKYPDTFDQYYRPAMNSGRKKSQRQPFLQQNFADAVPNLPNSDVLHRAGRSDQAGTADQTTKATNTTSVPTAVSIFLTMSRRNTSSRGCRCIRFIKAIALTKVPIRPLKGLIH